MHYFSYSCGVYRGVFLLGHLAVKIPRIRHFSSGLRCNRWEREMWRTWRPIFGWENLCPIKIADPFGVIVVMQRADQPVTAEDVDAAAHDYYPDITAEYKPEDWGRVSGVVFALDYGLPDADMVNQRREYYRTKEQGES